MKLLSTLLAFVILAAVSLPAFSFDDISDPKTQATTSSSGSDAVVYSETVPYSCDPAAAQLLLQSDGGTTISVYLCVNRVWVAPTHVHSLVFIATTAQ